MIWPMDMVRELRDNASMELNTFLRFHRCRWSLDTHDGFRGQLSRDSFGNYPRCLAVDYRSANGWRRRTDTCTKGRDVSHTMEGESEMPPSPCVPAPSRRHTAPRDICQRGDVDLTVGRLDPPTAGRDPRWRCPNVQCGHEFLASSCPGLHLGGPPDPGMVRPDSKAIDLRRRL